MILTPLLAPNDSKAQGDLSPKIKVLGTLATYGAVGGGLLGAASMAFGTTSRSIFQGASLGLYAGIIFGSYILISHQYRTKAEVPATYPTDAIGPYQYNGGDSDHLYRWQPQIHHRDAAEKMNEGKWRGGSREKGRSIPVYLDFLQYHF